MSLDTLIEFLLGRHFHHTMPLSYACILTPSQQTAYNLDALVQVLVIDMRQLAVILSQDSLHPQIERYVYPLACLILLEINIIIAITQLTVHRFVDALIVTYTLSCQASNYKDILGLLQFRWYGRLHHLP